MIDQDRVGAAGAPLDPTSFVGREQELAELRALAAASRAVTLCGAGGIGKTRLLLQLVGELADDFADGAWLVELGDLRQPELVVPRVAAVIGVAEEPGIPLLDTLADALRSRRLLLALDNCEHLIAACASLCQRLLAGSAGLQVLATSREPLRVAAEAVWQVPPLNLPPDTAGSPGPTDPAVTAGSPATAAGALDYDAVRLFAARARAMIPGFELTDRNAAAAVTICRALDGLPLAIELAAAWVRVLSADQIAARLDDRFRLLRSGDRTAPARHRTLRAAIDWSYELAGLAEQVLLRRLSVFASWSLEMAEQVCADDELPAGQILDLLSGLADKSLVEVEPDTLQQTRYRMLETIRDYAAARLEAAGETAAVRDRLRDYTLAVSERAMTVGMALVPAPWSARVDVFRRYDADAGNVREVLAWCLASGDIATGLRICTAVRPCWIVRGAFLEGTDWLDKLLAADLSGVPPAVHGPALVGRAQLALAVAPQAALEWARQGLALCRAGGDEFFTATALNFLAEAALAAGRADEAAGHGTEALDLARRAGDRWNEGYALGTSAAAAAHLGRLQDSQELAEAALAVMRAIDQQWGMARTLLGLGDLSRARGDRDAAAAHYAAALPILREVDARPAIARCVAGLGRLAMEQGDLREARARLTESLRLSLTAGSRIGIARGLWALAALALREDRPDRAVQLAAAVTAVREAAALPPLASHRTQRYLDAAAGLGEDAVSRLWAEGRRMSSSEAAELALTGPAGRDEPEPAGPPARTVSPAPAGPAGALTPREREVVALIARGASNRQIAAELFISPATAARHVANILGKLGYSSRSQVAAWAAAAR